jgi:hypothetical protein
VAQSLAARSTSTSTKTACKLSLTAQIPTGSTAATPAAERGTQYGPVSCRKVLGGGVQYDKFTLMATGNLQGAFRRYFKTGTIRGSFTLIPKESPPTSQTTFATTRYKGKSQIVGGTGAFSNAKGTGKLACSSPDGVHLSCKEKLTLSST